MPIGKSLGKPKRRPSGKMILEQWQPMTHAPYPRLAGIRAAQLFRQLIEHGWSQTAIAEKIGCNVSTVNKVLAASESDTGLPKGLRDDVITGIYYGIRVKADYLVMPVPKGYKNTVRLKDGTTRPTERHELDHQDFLVVTNAEFEQARDKKERQALRSDLDELRSEVRAGSAETRELREQVTQLLAALGADRPRSVR